MRSFILKASGIEPVSSNTLLIKYLQKIADLISLKYFQ